MVLFTKHCINILNAKCNGFTWVCISSLFTLSSFLFHVLPNEFVSGALRHERHESPIIMEEF